MVLTTGVPKRGACDFFGGASELISIAKMLLTERGILAPVLGVGVLPPTHFD